MQSTNGVHCGNVKNDRALGELWESNFCQLLPEGCVCDLHQKDRTSSAVLRVVLFPVCTGVNRTVTGYQETVGSLPRMHGGEPLILRNRPSVTTSSPYARG